MQANVRASQTVLIAVRRLNEPGAMHLLSTMDTCIDSSGGNAVRSKLQF